MSNKCAVQCSYKSISSLFVFQIRDCFHLLLFLLIILLSCFTSCKTRYRECVNGEKYSRYYIYYIDKDISFSYYLHESTLYLNQIAVASGNIVITKCDCDKRIIEY